MEITDVEVHTLSLPEIEEKAASTQDAAVIKVTTDEGLSGVGQAASVPPVVAKAIVEASMTSTNSRGVAEILLGRDPFDVEAIWRDLYRGTYGYGRKGATLAVISGVDIALWDVVGKAVGEPIHRLLGGKHRGSVRAYASTLFPQDPTDTDHVRREAERAIDGGFGAIKFGWGCFGAERDADERLVAAARDALGDDVDLMIDIGMAWDGDVKRAIREIDALDDEYGLYWAEEPVSAENLAGYRRIAEACGTRIVGGEREYTAYGFSEFVERGRPDGVQPDVGIAGGITQLREIASIAGRAGVPIYPHGYSTDIVIAASLHLVASVPNAPLLEYTVEESPIRWELTEESFPVEDGRVAIPDDPGLGVSLDRDALERYRVEPWTDW